MGTIRGWGPITGLNSRNKIILRNETLNTEVKVFKIDMGEYPTGVWSKDKFNTNPYNNKQKIVEMLDLTEKAEVAEKAASKDVNEHGGKKSKRKKQNKRKSKRRRRRSKRKRPTKRRK